MLFAFLQVIRLVGTSHILRVDCCLQIFRDIATSEIYGKTFSCIKSVRATLEFPLILNTCLALVQSGAQRQFSFLLEL